MTAAKVSSRPAIAHGYESIASRSSKLDASGAEYASSSSWFGATGNLPVQRATTRGAGDRNSALAPAGNLAMQRLLAARGIHAKMALSQPSDPDEQEADRVADAVISGASAPMIGPAVGFALARQCAACASGSPCGACEESQTLPAKREPGAKAPVGESLDHVVSTVRGGGQPLPREVRSELEPRFRRDLSEVRVHTDSSAASAARSIGARAFAYGAHIAFAPGEYRPAERDGRRLLAHEITHSVQAGRTPHPAQRSVSVQRKEDTTEAPLIDRYRAALSAGNWTLAAILLNGFSDADIQARVNDTAELPPSSRLQLRLHTPEWGFRVRRPLLVLDYEDARTSGRWADAATLLNGFSDPDIQLLASQLNADEVGPMVHGARQVMEGPSLYRVLKGIAHRYDEVSPDPPGTRVLTVVGLMQTAGMPVQAASAYVQLKLGVRVAADTAESGGSQQTSPDLSTDVNVFSAAMTSAGAMAMAGTSGAPKRLQPEQMEKGNLAHPLIGDTYCTLNPPSVYDWSVIDILGLVKGRVPGLAKAITAAQADLFTNLDMRPDIVDFGKSQIFEIKPVGSTAQAVAEAEEYVEIFDSLGISNLTFTLGQPGNPGTEGTIPGPDEVLVWASPLPGAIVYTFVRPPENPRRVRERIKSGAYERGLGLGPETVTALGFGAVAVVVALPEVSAAVAARYETLIPTLAKAAQLAGQAVPELVPNPG